MKTVYFDLNMGAAGDMLTAALLELHEQPEAVLDTLNRAFAGKTVLSVRKDRKRGISGSHVTVSIDGETEDTDLHGREREPAHGDGHVSREHHHGHHAHTSVAEVRGFIRALDLPAPVIRDALAVYDLIAEAEAHVHGQTMENIHFHEVGTVDAMADVVSVCYLIHALQPEQILASPVHVGSGTVHCAHGELSVPAPATQELLREIPIYTGDIRGELCTPTGAALLKHFVHSFGSMPPMRVSRIGYGFGTKDFPRLNGLRALFGETDGTVSEPVIELVCNIDDMTAEELAFAQERLFDAGALDVYFTDIGMKKSRPGVMLTCMCRAAQRDELLRCMFRHTSSLGIREYVCGRYTLSRESVVRETPYGSVRLKRSAGFGTVREKPEFEDLRKIAKEQDLPLREVRSLII